MDMNTTGDSIAGKGKELAGKVTGNKKQEMGGKIQYAAAKTRSRVERAVNEALDV